MCLVIDNNCAGSFFSADEHLDFQPARNWLFDGDGRLVHGGKLTQELEGNYRVLRTLQQLELAQKAVRLDSAEVERETAELVRGAKCVSDDHHVVAVMRVSGARLVLTQDAALMKDVTNAALLSQPRAGVYQRAIHKRLLGHSGKCGFAATGVWKTR